MKQILQINFLLLLFFFPLYLTTNPSHEVQVADGRAQYEMITRESSRPRYGKCWTEAMQGLEEGCKKLSDDVQSRLALRFANCFLEKAGQKTYPCPEEESISSCLEEVDSNAFNTYSNFFTHTQNMCYFLQSQVWQEDTEATIHSLSSNSLKVSQNLEESHTLQRQLVDKQEESLRYQRQLAENGTILARTIEASKGSVRDMLEEFKVSTFEQKTLIFEVFDRVSRLQNLVVSEVSWLYTVIFYGTCLLVIYLLTATKRTAEARLWMFIILTVNFAVERLVVKWSLPQSGEAEVMNLSQMVNDRIWMARQVSMSVATILLTAVAYNYKDYNKINHSLLEEIKKQNLELRMSMETFQVGRVSMDSLDSGITTSLTSAHQASLTDHLKHLLAEDTGFIGDEENYSDSDEDDLNTSGRTDVSYRPGSRNGSFSEDEYLTAANSREKTPVNEDLDYAMEALTSALVTTPVKVLDLTATAMNNLIPSTPRGCSTPTPKRSRAPIIRRDSNILATDLDNSGSPTTSRYNLRRTPNRTLGCFSPGSKSILEQESPEVFARVVKKQQNITKRNASKWNQALKKHHEADFSSDEQ